jgi:ribose transport system ATP-binding protein
MSVRNLSAGRIQDASLDLHAGEILGVVGMQGMGQLDLFRAMFGDIAPRAGQISVDGRPVELTSPRAAIDARLGISLVPEERKVEALALRLDGRKNVSLPVIDRFVRHGLIDTKAETAAVAAALARVQVDQRALYAPVSAFSGGNQQKIVLAKWFLAGSRVMLLYDPTRGVDVGTKHEIYLLMADYARSGGAVLFYSTELAEIINMSRRVLVVYAGRIAAELTEERGQITESAIMRIALGHTTPAPQPATAAEPAA